MRYKIFATRAMKHLLNKITDPTLTALKAELITESFSDAEMAVKFKESVRGCHLFIFGETSKSDNLVELLLAINAATLAAAREVTLVLPYFGYSRQDRQEGPRGSLGAAHMAKMLTSRELNGKVVNVVTIDLHAEQEKGFFCTPCDHLQGHTIFIDEVKKLVTAKTKLVSPDSGGLKRLEKYSSRLDLPMAWINKQRKKANEISKMELIGDVAGFDCILIDDIVDTCGTVKKAVDLLIEKGATSVSMAATHAVLSGKAIQNLIDSQLKTLLISDTVEFKYNLEEFFGLPEIKIISSIGIIEKALLNLISDSSVSELNN